MAKERIQRVLAAAGFGARRACELLVLDGRVSVNGQTVRRLPVLVDPQSDRIAVDGKPIRMQKPVYYLLNKPRKVLCTHNDPAGRTLAVDLLVGVRERVFPVGRLDAESSGLLLLTNDGELAQRLAHPRYGIPKTYRVEIDGCPPPEELDRLRRGVWLSEGKTAPAQISIVHRERTGLILEITLREGRNREIRRMLAKIGYRVRRLTRVRIGKLSIRKLPVGAFRPLTRPEIEYLQGLTPEGEAATQNGVAKAPQPRARRHSDRRQNRETATSAAPRRRSPVRMLDRQPPARRAAPKARRVIGPE